MCADVTCSLWPRVPRCQCKLVKQLYWHKTRARHLQSAELLSDRTIPITLSLLPTVGKYLKNCRPQGGWVKRIILSGVQLTWTGLWIDRQIDGWIEQVEWMSKHHRRTAPRRLKNVRRTNFQYLVGHPFNVYTWPIRFIYINRFIESIFNQHMAEIVDASEHRSRVALYFCFGTFDVTCTLLQILDTQKPGPHSAFWVKTQTRNSMITCKKGLCVTLCVQGEGGGHETHLVRIHTILLPSGMTSHIMDTLPRPLP